ncbi:MAG TPA: 4Fe-4S binding protein [Candidatus Omnitrophota bacterium]|nr:4Fe-4S binding protein [Candidatus Omnitrophota bacterium]
MCEFCVKHGEGEKWYLNAKNYSEDLASDINRRKYVKDFFHGAARGYENHFELGKRLPLKMPIIGPVLKAILRHKFMNKHWGQVIPIEDVEKVLSITTSIVRIPCACAKITTGKERRSCFVITLKPEFMEYVDQSFFGGPDVAKFEKVDKQTALNFIKAEEPNGAVHSVWTFKTPFIGALCNCNDTECIAIKMYKDIIPNFFRSEYIAQLDRNNCIGCKACMKVCLFKALEYDTENKKVKIDQKKCYGCGICRSVCKKNAITLQDRASIPESAHLW